MLLNHTRKQRFILTDFSNQNPTADFLNPALGAAIGGALGAGKGALQQNPYEETDPGERAWAVATNAGLGAGLGTGVGLIPRLAAENPTANKVASVVESDIGIPIMPQPSPVSKVQNRTADVEARIRQLQQEQEVLERNRQLRLMERQLRREKAANRLAQVQENINQYLVEPAVKVADAVTPAAKVVGNTLEEAVKIPIQAGANVRQNLPQIQQTAGEIKQNLGKVVTGVRRALNFNNSYMGTVNFNRYYPPMPMSPETLGKTMAVGAGIGTAGGALLGASKAFEDNWALQDRRLGNLENIQDPYLRIRQQEIYDSTPAQVGRAVGDIANGVGTTALGAGIGAGLGATGLAAGLMAYKNLSGSLPNPTQPQPNRFVRAGKVIITGKS